MSIINLPVVEHPNLACPSCNRQFQTSDWVSVQPTNFAKLTQTISCPGCSEDINPEDATLEYLDQIASNQVLGHALTVGGFVNIATKEIEIGKTEEYTIEPDSDYEISLALQDETDKPPGLDIDQLSGEQFKWHDSHLLIDDLVVVDPAPVNDSDVGLFPQSLINNQKIKSQ